MRHHHQSLTQFAMQDPAGFTAWCDQLRAAGVGKLGALVLVAKPRTPGEKEDADPDAEAKRRHAIMFAASRVKPPFVAPAPAGGSPRAIVQRQARDEAANGTHRRQ